MEQITLRALRINFSLTAKEVAKKIGISYQTLLKYEIDSSKIPYDLLIKLANFYGVSPDKIFLGKKYELKRKLQLKDKGAD